MCVDDLQEEARVHRRARAERGQHVCGDDQAVRVVAGSERPVVVSGAVCLLQLDDRHLGPRLPEPGHRVTARIGCPQRRRMTEVQAEPPRNRAAGDSFFKFMGFPHRVPGLSRYGHVLHHQELQARGRR
jgi:hypothetical protein